MVKILTAKEAVETYFYSGATVTFGGFANGLMHPEAIMAALEQAGRAGRLRDLKVVFASGQGDSGERGLNHLAVDGLCETVIGGHWGLAVRLGEMAMKNSFAAYNLPQGVIAQLFREIAANRPGILTHVGLETFVDPRVEGGKVNQAARDAGDIVKLMEINGEEKLFYPAFPIDIAVIRLPRISNFTDFSPLESHPALGVRYVQTAAELGQPDLVILPGTKSTMADLLWLRQNGLEAAIQKLAARGLPILGVCGGYQMLGRWLDDPTGCEGGGRLRGMGLLPVDTVFCTEKTRTRVQARTLTEPLNGAKLDAYEIHMGETMVEGAPFCRLDDGRTEGCVCGNVFGTYLHGLFDSGELTEKLARWLCRRKGIPCQGAVPASHRDYQERQLDLLAQTVRAALDMREIYRIMGLERR